MIGFDLAPNAGPGSTPDESLNQYTVPEGLSLSTPVVGYAVWANAQNNEPATSGLLT